MTTLAAGSSTTVTVPSGSTLFISGMGTAQAAPGGTVSGARPLHVLRTEEQQLRAGANPLSVNVVADSAGGGVTYTVVAETDLVVRQKDGGGHTGAISSSPSIILSNGREQALGGFAVNVRREAGDLSSKIQAAMELCYARTDGQGGTVFLGDEGEYLATGLILPPRVSFMGGGTTFSEVYSGQADSGAGEPYAIKGPVLKQVNSATLPLLQNDTSRGYNRQASNVLNDGGAVALRQRYAASTISGIFFEGNVLNQTVPASLLYFERAWALNIEKCNIIHSAGYGLELNDCNAITMDSVWSHYAPWFFYDVADSQMQRCDVAGSNRFASSLWLHSSGCQNNLFCNNLIYNSSQNTEASWTNTGDTSTVRIRRAVESFTASAGTDTLVNITSHKLYDEMPIVFFTSGTLPAGMYPDRVYWVKRTNGNTFKISENRNRVRNGVYVQATDAGSGTIYADRGYAANLLLTGGANRNQFLGVRLDQSYGDGALVVGSQNNTFVVNANQAGLGSTAARSGIRLRSGYIEVQPVATTLQGSSGNTLIGNVDGTSTVYGGQNTNQTQGLVVDDSASMVRLNAASLNAVNHATSDYSPNAIGTRSRHITRTGTTVTRTGVAGAADLINSAMLTVTIPANSLGPNGYISVDLYWNNNNTTAREFSMTLGGANAGPVVAMTTAHFNVRDLRIMANNSTAQIKFTGTTVINAGSSATQSTSAIDTTADMTLVINARWTATPTAGDTIKLESADVRTFYG